MESLRPRLVAERYHDSREHHRLQREWAALDASRSEAVTQRMLLETGRGAGAHVSDSSVQSASKDGRGRVIGGRSLALHAASRRFQTLLLRRFDRAIEQLSAQLVEAEARGCAAGSRLAVSKRRVERCDEEIAAKAKFLRAATDLLGEGES